MSEATYIINSRPQLKDILEGQLYHRLVHMGILKEGSPMPEVISNLSDTGEAQAVIHTPDCLHDLFILCGIQYTVTQHPIMKRKQEKLTGIQLTAVTFLDVVQRTFDTNLFQDVYNPVPHSP